MKNKCKNWLLLHLWKPACLRTDWLRIFFKLIPNQVLSRLKKTKPSGSHKKCEKCPNTALYQPPQSFQKCWPKSFADPNWHILNFLHPIVMCRVIYWAPLGLRHLSRGGNPSHFLTIGSNCWSLRVVGFARCVRREISNHLELRSNQYIWQDYERCAHGDVVLVGPEKDAHMTRRC